MQVRCQNCGTPVNVPAGSAPHEVQCAHCGARMMVPPPTAPLPRRWHGLFHRSHATLKRVYEPIPRPVAYLAGTALALALTAPFWMYLLKERLERHKPVIADDTKGIVVPPVTDGTSSVPVVSPPDTGTLTLDRFHGVRLDAGREDLLRRYNLGLQNTRGMVPEIYEAERSGDIEQMTAVFYGNALKEFSMRLHARPASADDVQKELTEQFSEPQQVQESANATGELGSGLPALTNDSSAAQVARKLATFRLRRELTWADSQNHIEVTIYHNLPEVSAPVSLLAIRISAAAWLRANHPLVTAVPPARPGLMEQPVLP